MVEVMQATTPTFQLTFPEDLDLSSAVSIVFSLRQGNLRIDKNQSQFILDGNVMSVFLSQMETMRMTIGPARIQVNILYPNGVRCATTIETVQIDENLLKEVMR